MQAAQASFGLCLWDSPMGEARETALRLDSDRRLKRGFHGTKVTRDADLQAVTIRMTQSGWPMIGRVFRGPSWPGIEMMTSCGSSVETRVFLIAMRIAASKPDGYFHAIRLTAN